MRLRARILKNLANKQKSYEELGIRTNKYYKKLRRIKPNYGRIKKYYGELGSRAQSKFTELLRIREN